MVLSFYYINTFIVNRLEKTVKHNKFAWDVTGNILHGIRKYKCQVVSRRKIANYMCWQKVKAKGTFEIFRIVTIYLEYNAVKYIPRSD